jgi:Mrp family chromosome partitioning ATPase
VIPVHVQEVETVYRRILETGCRVFAVAAPARGQGATTLAFAAARRCAAAGSRVLLAELHTRSSGLDSLIGLARQPWLPTAADAASAITLVEGGRLGLLAAPLHERLPHGFREPAVIAELVAGWRQSFDIVFIETAPLGSHDSHEIGAVNVMRASEGIFLSTMPRRTTARELDHAMALVQQSGVPIAGVVANDLFNPRLADELRREVARILRRPGRIRAWIEARIGSLPLLEMLP